MPKFITILVLGDLGRSPRMLNHAKAIVNLTPFHVNLIGYNESEIYRSLKTNKKIHLLSIPNKSFQKFPKHIYIALIPFIILLRFIYTIFLLFYTANDTELIIVQNPPSHPTFITTKIICLLTGIKFYIDWHNIGHTLLSLKLGNNHYLVKIYKFFEKKLGQSADGHFCVSKAMKSFLLKNWGIKAYVIYDQPNIIHRRSTVMEIDTLFKKLDGEIKKFCRDRTIMTYNDNGIIRLKDDKPFVIVSPTSWTVDENMDLLLDSIVMLDKQISKHKFLFFLTGIGPLLSYYRRKINKMELKNCEIRTIWLDSYEDYSILLGCSDGGICMHISSSGIDLPMKVLDMIGCEVPIFAIKYDCLDELVVDKRNGYVFKTSEELAKRMYDSFVGINQKEFYRIKQNVVQDKLKRNWLKDWEKIVMPVLNISQINLNVD